MQIKALYISHGHDFKGRHGKGRLNHGIEKVPSVECVGGRGLIGDRYFDYNENFKGQITFFDWAVYEQIKAHFQLEELDPACFRRNVLIQGVDLNTLTGQRFTLQGVEFEGSEECAPCYWMDEAIAPGAEALMKGRGGLRARIISDGTLTVDPDILG